MGCNVYDLLMDPIGVDLAIDDILFSGFEAGFNERSDVVVQAADGTDLNEMWREIQATLAVRQQQRNQLIDEFTFRVSDVIETVAVPSDVDFEVASEFGQPKGIRGGKTFNRGYDFQFYDLAVRYTWMFIAEANRAQLEGLNNQALDADNRLLFNRIMKTIYNPTNLLGTVDNNIPITVNKFYNGDGEVPPSWKTNTFSGSHTHYVGSNVAGGASATFDSEKIQFIEDDMISHGYGMQNGTKLVLYVSLQEGKIARTFRVATGDPYDFIPSEGYGGGVLLPFNGGIVARPTDRVPGQIGTYGPWHIVEDLYFPAGYILGLATGGPDSLANPIGIREHKNPAYQGLKHIPGSTANYPLIDSFYRRGFGTGVRQRGGGFVMQIVASASYTTPAAYV